MIDGRQGPEASSVKPLQALGVDSTAKPAARIAAPVHALAIHQLLSILVAKQHAFEPLARSSFKSSTRNFACKTGQYLSRSTASKTSSGD